MRAYGVHIVGRRFAGSDVNNIAPTNYNTFSQ
jgi:hypothetical protein